MFGCDSYKFANGRCLILSIVAGAGLLVIGSIIHQVLGPEVTSGSETYQSQTQIIKEAEKLIAKSTKARDLLGDNIKLTTYPGSSWVFHKPVKMSSGSVTQ